MEDTPLTYKMINLLMTKESRIWILYAIADTNM